MDDKIVIYWPSGAAELKVCYFFPAKQGKLKRMMKLLAADFDHRVKNYDLLITSLEQYIRETSQFMIQLDKMICQNHEALIENQKRRNTKPAPSGEALKRLQVENRELRESKTALSREYRKAAVKIGKLRANLKWLRGARTW